MDEAMLKLLLDERAISRVLDQYATGVDTCNWALYRTIFTDEVDIDFSSWDPSAKRTMQVDEWMATVHAVFGFQATQHIITNRSIDVDGDRATCVAYVQAQHFLPNERGENTVTLGGYYTHSLVRSPDGWKICKCKLTITWVTGNWQIFDLAAKRVAQR